MSCGKRCEKLWNNYLMKYGDFRERLQLIKNHYHQCFTPIQLQPINFQSKSSRKKTVTNGVKCDPSLPSECCYGSIMKNNRLYGLNDIDLEKLIEAENFPDNIFPVKTESRSSSIDNETDLSQINNLHRLDPILSQSNVKSSIHTSIEKSEVDQSAEDITKHHRSNPYTQLLERLRQAENSDEKIEQKPSRSTIAIEKFLSFLHSLDDISDNQQNSTQFDENTLKDLFSVDNQLSSSLYVPINIRQLNIVPESIINSLKNTPDNKSILNQIQNKRTQNEINYSIPKQQEQISNFIDQDNELNSRLGHSYTIKAFKDYLIHQKKSRRLPKIFDDIDPSYKN